MLWNVWFLNVSDTPRTRQNSLRQSMEATLRAAMPVGLDLPRLGSLCQLFLLYNRTQQAMFDSIVSKALQRERLRCCNLPICLCCLGQQHRPRRLDIASQSSSMFIRYILVLTSSRPDYIPAISYKAEQATTIMSTGS